MAWMGGSLRGSGVPGPGAALVAGTACAERIRTGNPVVSFFRATRNRTAPQHFRALPVVGWQAAQHPHADRFRVPAWRGWAGHARQKKSPPDGGLF
ncbi:MAG TPA: hypothetical protein PKE36_07675 [Chiayiivirga sp.]|nr:hypothetical protein [Chiayiivirga sp.]